MPKKVAPKESVKANQEKPKHRGIEKKSNESWGNFDTLRTLIAANLSRTVEEAINSLNKDLEAPSDNTLKGSICGLTLATRKLAEATLLLAGSNLKSTQVDNDEHTEEQDDPPATSHWKRIMRPRIKDHFQNYKYDTEISADIISTLSKECGASTEETWALVNKTFGRLRSKWTSCIFSELNLPVSNASALPEGKEARLEALRSGLNCPKELGAEEIEGFIYQKIVGAQLKKTASDRAFTHMLIKNLVTPADFASYRTTYSKILELENKLIVIQDNGSAEKWADEKTNKADWETIVANSDDEEKEE